MLSLRFILASAPVLALVATAPSRAEACSPDPCQESNRWVSFEVASTVIAPDGVVRISASRNPGAATIEDSLFYANLEVSDPMGNVVEGALEYQPDTHAYAWRPTAPLLPSTSYAFSLVVDNTALAMNLDEEWVAQEEWCGEDIAVEGSFDTAADPLPPLSLPDPTAVEGYEAVPLLELDGLVCCDGAYPVEDFLCGDFGDVYWTEGTCASSVAFGSVGTTMSLPEGVLPPEVLTNLAIRIVQTDGNQVRYASVGSLGTFMQMPEPFCARIEAVDITGGEVWQGPEECYGDDLVDVLGRHDIDPSEGLAVCEGEPYVCQLDGDMWDPDACTPWDDGGGSGSGGGEGSGGDESGGGSGDDGPNEDGGDESGGTSPQDDGGLDGRGCACRAGRSDFGPTAPWLLLVGFAWLRVRRRPR